MGCSAHHHAIVLLLLFVLGFDFYTGLGETSGERFPELVYTELSVFTSIFRDTFLCSFRKYCVYILLQFHVGKGGSGILVNGREALLKSEIKRDSP